MKPWQWALLIAAVVAALVLLARSSPKPMAGRQPSLWDGLLGFGTAVANFGSSVASKPSSSSSTKAADDELDALLAGGTDNPLIFT